MKTPSSHYSFNNKSNMSVSTGVFGGSALSRVRACNFVPFFALKSTFRGRAFLKCLCRDFLSVSVTILEAR